MTRSELMLPGEVADAFHVSGKTVARWAKEGKLRHVRTLGGHRRYVRAHVEALVAEHAGSAQALEAAS